MALAVLSAAVLLSSGTTGVAASSRDGSTDPRATTVYTLSPDPGGSPEGVAWDHRSKAFFTGITSSGVIYRGTLDSSAVVPYLTPAPAAAGNAAVGMKLSHGRLFVAGGPTGSIYVYDIATRSLRARFETGAGGFLNDLVVTRRGDVYVTDSFRSTIWHVSPAMLAAGTGTPEAVSLAPEVVIPAVPGTFRLNGIVARHGGRELIVVDSTSGALYRIFINPNNTAERRVSTIDAPALPGGDGMIVDRGRLVVVQGSTAANPNGSLSFLKRKHHDSRARLVSVRSDPSLHGPSTVARARHTYLVVNADFAGVGSPPFTISGLSRRGGH
jgi:Cu-Zn family superoxide dismutase